MNKTRELPTEIWDFLFFASNDGLTESDKVVLSKASPLFEAVLRGKLIEECVTALIPVVAPYLSKRDLLKLRQTCKGLKQRVEELEENRFGSSFLLSLELRDDQRWNKLAGMIEKQGGNGTLGRWLSLAVEPEMELENDKAAQFFKKYGHRIFNLKLRVGMNCVESLRYRLVNYLKCCESLRRLQLFPEIVLTGLNNFPPQRYLMSSYAGYQRSPDPIGLPFLTELTICSKFIRTDNNREWRTKVDLFFEVIFRYRMDKLTKLEISSPYNFTAYVELNFMPSPSFVTDLNIVFESQSTIETLQVLQRNGTKLKKLTLREEDFTVNFDILKAQLANYLQGALTLRNLSLVFRTRVAFFTDFPSLESAVRFLILRNVIFPDGKGLKNLGAFKSLYKLHLSYDGLHVNAENYDFTPDINDIFDHVPSIRQVTVKSFNTPTVYSINHQH